MEEKKFIEHLEDLRRCLIKSALGLAVGVVFSLLFVSYIFKLIARPYTDYLISQGLPSSQALRSLSPADTLQMTLKAALLFGFGLASPWIAYQLWKFIAPALHKHEKKYTTAFCASVAAFFLAGVMFAYFLVLPAALSFFYKYSMGMGISPEWAIGNYFNFVIAFLVGFGIVFELPIAIVILTLFGIVNSRILAAYRRHAIVGIFIVAAIFTPGPDVASQLLMAVPMVVLYEISALAAKVIEIKRRKNTKVVD